MDPQAVASAIQALINDEPQVIGVIREGDENPAPIVEVYLDGFNIMLKV